MPRRVLIVGSFPELESVLDAEGAEVASVKTRRALVSRLERGRVDLLLLDDTDLIGSVRAIDAQLPIVVVAEKGNVRSAGEAVAKGANDFLVLGPRLAERVRTMLEKSARVVRLIDQNRALEEEVESRFEIVGTSPQIRAVLEKVEKVAGVPRPLLVVGERGTGKELVARAIHRAAGPPGRPFVAVNCAALADTLLESELFGHEKGAFSGAASLRIGKFEQAAGGTLFLDEIGHMSRAFQQKILRVVEYGVFTRVGGSEEIRASARIVAATNADLEDRIERGDFLADLYDRLAFETIRVPPLRERDAEIETLAQHFLDQFMREVPGFQGKRLSKEALDLLHRYPFPGNVRELKNIIERAVYRDTTNELTPEDIGLLDLPVDGGTTFKEKVFAYEKRLLSEALDGAGGNQAQAARDLGLSYHQLRYFCKKHGLT